MMEFSTLDQLGRTVLLPFPPKRIISLVPSITELLHSLGLEHEVIGITKFCIHPQQWFRTKQRIGGTKNVNIDLIKKLNPDLIIANKEENQKEDILLLANSYPTWISDVTTIRHAHDMILALGKITDRLEKGTQVANHISDILASLHSQKTSQKIRVIYLIWNEPIMAVGNNTYIHSLIEHLGYENVITHQNRYPIISAKELQIIRPDVIFLSSEPFPFKQKHLEFFQSLCPETAIKLVDGELFSWYGSRLLSNPTYFRLLRSELEESMYSKS